MTLGLAVLGVCHLMTAAGLTDAGRVSRALLAIGGAATIGVAALPQPSAGHGPAATVAFLALVVWPAASRLPWRWSARAATLALTVLLFWFAFELHGGELLGLSERVLAGAEALCPLAFAVACRQLKRR